MLCSEQRPRRQGPRSPLPIQAGRPKVRLLRRRLAVLMRARRRPGRRLLSLPLRPAPRWSRRRRSRRSLLSLRLAPLPGPGDRPRGWLPRPKRNRWPPPTAGLRMPRQPPPHSCQDARWPRRPKRPGPVAALQRPRVRPLARRCQTARSPTASPLSPPLEDLCSPGHPPSLRQQGMATATHTSPRTSRMRTPDVQQPWHGRAGRRMTDFSPLQHMLSRASRQLEGPAPGCRRRCWRAQRHSNWARRRRQPSQSLRYLPTRQLLTHQTFCKWVPAARLRMVSLGSVPLRSRMIQRAALEMGQPPQATRTESTRHWRRMRRIRNGGWKRGPGLLGSRLPRSHRRRGRQRPAMIPGSCRRRPRGGDGASSSRPRWPPR
mmetsp:Transcript_5538/g.15452  ORF Transcript_5538/g.15452 Transcript_5538/m.15452 type:complete len:375 (+) Transcript_5538:1006-2130(+)